MDWGYWAAGLLGVLLATGFRTWTAKAKSTSQVHTAAYQLLRWVLLVSAQVLVVGGWQTFWTGQTGHTLFDAFIHSFTPPSAYRTDSTDNLKTFAALLSLPAWTGSGAGLS